MARVNVIFYSMFGHNWRMAEAVAEGARGVDGTEVKIFQVQETLPEDLIREIGGLETRKQFAHIPVATLDSLTEADGIVFGTPTRYGMMCAQMRAYLDATGPLWAAGALVDKIGSVFTSTNTQHGGQESTILSFHVTLLHHGMIIVGVPYTEKSIGYMEDISGGGPYGASSIVGPESNRPVTENELTVARAQGRRVAELAKRMFG